MTTRRQFITATLTTAASAYGVGKVLGKTSASNALGNSVPAAGIAPQGTIDWHTHWFSKRSIDILSRRTDVPRIGTGQNGVLSFISNVGNSSGLPLTPDFTDIDARLEHINSVGISRQIISWPTTLGVDGILSAEESKPLWTAYNEDLGELVKEHPDRFSGLAALPTSDPEWAAGELERAHKTLGLIGAVLPVGAFQTLEGAKRLTPIFEVAQQYGSHIYLHTGPASKTIPGQIPLITRPDDAPAIRSSLDRASTFAQGAITLTQTDFLVPYPNVSLQVAMLGGSVTFLTSWLRIYGRGDAESDSTERLRRIYIDTGVYGRAPHTVEFASRAFGSDRILFGSDFPLAPTDHTTSVITKSAISDQDKKQIFVANGQTLYNKITNHTPSA